MRGPMARLHYIGPAAMLAPVFVAVAILAEKGFSQAGLKAILIAVVVLLETPPLTHILGRAISFHERKQLREKDRDQNA
jgi:multisubunit Na+/H+ antiporter MnhG subunit